MAPGPIIDVDEPIHIDLTADPPTIDLTSDVEEEAKHPTTLQPLLLADARPTFT
jgi:hypothetical protein